MLAVLVLAALSLKGAASSMPDYPIAVASHDFSLSVFTVFCNVLFFICKFAKFTSSGMDAVHYTSFFKR
jgi:hypothetical protein